HQNNEREEDGSPWSKVHRSYIHFLSLLESWVSQRVVAVALMRFLGMRVLVQACEPSAKDRHATDRLTGETRTHLRTGADVDWPGCRSGSA
ncbi:hypothetical protein, partial [Pseudomonas coronafaciens]|uniref:hypothetical protein n=1 Tax=Pseudomonas coronafaciens TaxID=53409 RepID=UPI001C1010A5